MKKNQKFWVREHHKNIEKAKKEEEDAAKRNKNLEDAKKLTLVQDPTLPVATLIKIKNAKEHRNSRVKIYGWVHRLRRQGICNFKTSKIDFYFLLLHVKNLKCYLAIN